jgi:hypothetical protein
MALQLSASIPAFPDEDRRDAMMTTLRWTLGLALTSGLAGLGYAAPAAPSETTPAITIHMHNYARVAPETLAEAEEVTTGIFREAGLETRWANTVLNAEDDRNHLVAILFTVSQTSNSVFCHARCPTVSAFRKM